MTKTIAQEQPARKRRLRSAYYRSFRLQKKVVNADAVALPSGWSLFKGSLGVIKTNWKIFTPIMAIYLFLSFIFVQTVNGDNIQSSKQILDSLAAGQWGEVVGGISVFIHLVSGSSQTSEISSMYQFLLTITMSLALIWTFRQVYANKKAAIREAFYRSMHPLIPFLLVLVVVALELIPLLLGAFIYGQVDANGLAVGIIEKILWVVILALFALVSFYMLTSSLFALYIVCLPDMTPMVALNSARDMVHHRRWTVMRKIALLPIILCALLIVIILPFIFIAPIIASILFLIMSMLMILLIHGYMYRLYRALL